MAKSDKQRVAGSVARNKAKDVKRVGIGAPRTKLNKATKAEPGSSISHILDRDAGLRRPPAAILGEQVIAKAQRLHGGNMDSPAATAGRATKIGQAAFEMGFCVVLAKTQLSDGVDRKKDWGVRRETLMEIVGDIGWCNTIHVLASCLRLWAEVPGIVPTNEDHKKIAHDLAAAVSAVSHQFRLLDDHARRPGKEAK